MPVVEANEDNEMAELRKRADKLTLKNGRSSEEDFELDILKEAGSRTVRRRTF